MKRILSLVLCAAILLSTPILPLPASAATESYYTYSVYNGWATITGCNASISGNVVIPTTLGGYPVAIIGDSAFEWCESLISVVIPDSVTTIDNSAFRYCTSLTSITIPDSVTTIGNSAFADCTSLTSVTIGNGVWIIDQWAFSWCENLTSVIIGDGISWIGSSAFGGCYTLELVVYAGTQEQWDDILIESGNTALTNAVRHDNSSADMVTTIHSCGCSLFTCSECGVFYASMADVPAHSFTNDTCTVCGVDRIWKYTIESVGTVTITGTENAPAVLTVPAQIEGLPVTAIGNSAFYNNTSLTGITIPDSVTTIGDYAFYFCYDLTDVYYAGSKARWEEITIGDRNEDLTGATIHYNHVHDYSLFDPVTVQYCDQAGYTEYTCVYGETHRVTLPALGHLQETEGVVTAPTCTEQGYTTYVCGRCSETVKTDMVATLEHDCTIPLGTIAPSCEEDGYTGMKCSRCEYVQKTDIVYALGHNMVVLPAVAPTCTETGLTKGTGCDRCGKVGIAQNEVAATGHNYVDGICTNCSRDTVIDENGISYTNMADALAAGNKLTLTADIAEDIVIDKDIVLDLNGHSITGTITVSDGCTLYGMDSQTDDYTVEDDFGYGKLTDVVGNVVGLPEESDSAQDGYLMITEDDGISFHRVNLQISSMSLRASAAGVYFKSDFAADEVVAAQVKSFGVALSIKGMPNANNLSSCQYSTFKNFTAGENKDATSTLLKGIMKESNPYLINKANANADIYSRAYIQLADGSYIFGAGVQRSLRQQVEMIDAMWESLSDDQKASVLEMYNTYISVMKSWEIPNIIAAA